MLIGFGGKIYLRYLRTVKQCNVNAMRDNQQVWIEAGPEAPRTGFLIPNLMRSFDLGKIMITFDESMLFTC